MITSMAEPQVQAVPPPWKANCETYWLLLNLPKELPKGIYDPLEASYAPFSHPAAVGSFTAGLGMIQIVRYADTPVGPYDELLIIPGNYKVPSLGKHRLRISRIYVSGRATTWNGRKNWNTPKHLARFEFSSPPTKDSRPPRTLHVAVYPPSPDATAPFFSVTLTPFSLPPVMPFSSSWLPLGKAMAQPPLPQATEGPDKDVIIGTSNWAEWTPVLSTKRMRGCWVEMQSPKKGSEEEKEAERWWPISGKPWSIGLWFENATLSMPEPTTWIPE